MLKDVTLTKEQLRYAVEKYLNEEVLKVPVAVLEVTVAYDDYRVTLKDTATPEQTGPDAG